MDTYDACDIRLLRFKQGKAFPKERRLLLEDISAFESAVFKDGASFPSCAPITFSERISVKLDIGSAVGFSLNNYKFDYAVIKAHDSANPMRNATYYYFIDSFERVSDSVARAEMTVDELNTISGNNYLLKNLLSDRCIVKREHKNRFFLKANRWLPLIDRIPEGIGFPVKRIFTSYVEDDAIDWTTFYFSEAQSGDSPIAMRVAPNKAVSVAQPTAAQSITIDLSQHLLPNGAYYVTEAENSGDGIVRLRFTNSSGGQNVQEFALSEEMPDPNNAALKLKCLSIRLSIINANQVKAVALFYDAENNFATSKEISSGIGSAGAEVEITFPKCLRDGVYGQDKLTALSDILALPPMPAPYFDASSTVARELRPSTEISRTSLYLKKAIENPYRPFSYSGKTADGTPILWDGMRAANGILVFADKSLFGKNEFSFYPTERKVIGELSLPQLLETPTEDPNGKQTALANETKAYHSDFYFVKLVYDSFSLEMKEEECYFNVNIGSEENKNIVFRFIASSDMVSEFYFSPRYYPGVNPKEPFFTTHFKEDYPNLLIINRNNETPVFTSAYLDYLRTGYNYDLKSQAVAIGLQGLGVALNAINAGVGLASAAVTGGMTAPYAVGATTSLISSIVNLGTNASENNRGNAQRLNELRAQGASVAGNSDYDISKAYTKNRVKMVGYRIEGEALEAVKNMFYLKGYASAAVKRPTLDNRASFDYLEAEPDLSPEAMVFPKWIRDLLADDVRAGVTAMHYRGEADGYDVNQTSSNWENDILHTPLGGK